MKIKLAQIDSWRAEARTLSPPDSRDRTVNKTQAVTLMATELRALSRRGYSPDQLVAWLATKGLVVHRETLKRCLRKGRKARPTTPRISDQPKHDGGGNRTEGAKPITPRPRARPSDDGRGSLNSTSATGPRPTVFPRPDSDDL